MTRLGPLTSEALVGVFVLKVMSSSAKLIFIKGRSPFDIFVPGTGEPDPRAPPQTYDEHGRPFNSESRRIHRSIIRAHNELMQAVGVARPNTLTPECAFDCQIIQQMHEDNIGHRIFGYMRAVGVLGVWGAEPLRQRTLVRSSSSQRAYFVAVPLADGAALPPLWRRPLFLAGRIAP